MLHETDIDGANGASSAYSSLTNSSAELSHTEGDSLKMSSQTKMRQEIRSIIDDYGATISKATQEIKSLTKAKASVEKAYEELMAVNEKLIKDLMLEIQHKKELQSDHERVVKANEELFNETQRLSDKESFWNEEKEALEIKLANVTHELDRLKHDLFDVEAMESEAAEKSARMVSILRAEKSDLEEAATKLEIENKRLRKELEMAEEERDAILSRKELVSGENLQLIVEAEHFRAAKTDLINQVKIFQDRCIELENENAKLKLASETNRGVEVSNEKFAAIVERNKLLTEWREQLIEKNQLLTEENKKLKDKCTGLEDLLSEEETDISDVLELIRSMQLASKNGTSVGPISPMSAVASKLRRDFK